MISTMLRGVILFAHNMLAFSQNKYICRLRCSLLRLMQAKIPLDCNISKGLYLLNGANLSIGKNARIGMFARIYDFEEILIGDNALISHQLTIISGTHFNNAERSYKPAPVEIGTNVWIGINVTIVGPVKIGNNVTIGALSLVIDDIPDNSTYGGVPAKNLK